MVCSAKRYINDIHIVGLPKGLAFLQLLYRDYKGLFSKTQFGFSSMPLECTDTIKAYVVKH